MRNLAILITLTLMLTACASPATPPFIPTSTPTIASTSTITPTPTVGPGGFPRRFRVQGNTFVDQFGYKMIFRGVVIPDPVQMSLGGNPALPAFNEHYFQVIASWGANIIRVPIVPFSLRTWGLVQTLSSLDQTIAWAGKNKLYVIIEFQSNGWIPDNWYSDANSSTTLDEWTGFWKAISSHYAGKDGVAFYELFNEPKITNEWNLDSSAKKKGWMVWKGLVETLINNTIRPNDPDKIILVGGLQGAYNLTYVASAPIADPSDEIAYTVHPYADHDLRFTGETSPSDWDLAFGKLSSKYPVFATEVGYDKISWPGSDPTFKISGTPYHKAIIDYLEAHSIGWTAWGFCACWPPSLVKDNQNFVPSEEGTYFKSRLLELNLPGIPTLPPSTPLPTPTK